MNLFLNDYYTIGMQAYDLTVPGYGSPVPPEWILRYQTHSTQSLRAGINRGIYSFELCQENFWKVKTLYYLLTKRGIASMERIHYDESSDNGARRQTMRKFD